MSNEKVKDTWTYNTPEGQPLPPEANPKGMEIGRSPENYTEYSNAVYYGDVDTPIEERIVELNPLNEDDV